MKHTKETRKLSSVIIVVLGIFCMIVAGLVGYFGAPKYIKEITIIQKENEEDIVEINTEIKQVNPSHVGAKIVGAATIDPRNDLVQMIEAPKINPFTGKPEVDYSSKGTPLHVPAGVGSVHSYMAWNCVTDPTTKQYKLRVEAEAYDENDFGKIGDRYVVAVKPYYGKIGDYIDVIQEDDSVLRCIIGDYKGDENEEKDGENSKYYHHDRSVVEFIVNGYAWYNSECPRTVYDYHPEWQQNIKSIYNVGNYWGE